MRLFWEIENIFLDISLDYGMIGLMKNAREIFSELVNKHGLNFRREPIAGFQRSANCTMYSGESEITVKYSEEPCIGESDKDVAITLEHMLQDVGFTVCGTTEEDPRKWDFSDEDDPNVEEEQRLDFSKDVEFCDKLKKAFGKEFMRDLRHYVSLLNCEKG